ncbi:hypothetical protein BZG36_04156 [Bifiguratus adelaidae]|uniref:RRM domain-containing protein n=1 Tax=Bifiguratus adelaidae TaxID=1938954 RepID=A0A261XZF1_9FUNG|nr:hypothetical protein BZG36_04156 [Bifiguratus adelaidae]
MTTRVYLGKLSPDARTRDIERLFRSYGDIREITLKNGFGFVEFRDRRDAEDVVYDFHGKSFMGERLIVELARGTRADRDRRRDDRADRPSNSQKYRIIIDGLAPRTTWQDIKDYFKQAGGTVTFADVLKDREGEGVVEFANYDDMKHALDTLNNGEIRGAKISLREQPKRDDRARSRSKSPPRRSRSRSRSPARRRSRSRSKSPSPRRSSRRDRNDRDRDDRRRNSDDDRDRAPKSGRRDDDKDRRDRDSDRNGDDSGKSGRASRGRDSSADRDRNGRDKSPRKRSASPRKIDSDDGW